MTHVTPRCGGACIADIKLLLVPVSAQSLLVCSSEEPCGRRRVGTRRPSARRVDHSGDAHLVRQSWHLNLWHPSARPGVSKSSLQLDSFEAVAAPPVSACCLFLGCVCGGGLLPTPVLLFLRSEGHRGGLAALCEEACRRDDPDCLLPQHLCPGRPAALHGKSKPDVYLQGL